MFLTTASPSTGAVDAFGVSDFTLVYALNRESAKMS